MSPSPSAPEAESPNSPSSTPPPPPAPPVTSGLFLPPKGPAALLPPPSPSSSTSGPSRTSSQFDDAAPTWSDGYADSEATSDRDASSDTPSTADTTAAKVTKSGLKAIVGGAVKTVTNAVATIAASRAEQQFDLWRADPEDVEGISTPASRILWRRVPAEARDSDTIDLFALGLALAAYLAKNLMLRADLRAGMAAGDLVQVGDHVGRFVPSGDAAADAAAAEAWGVPGYPAPAP